MCVCVCVRARARACVNQGFQRARATALRALASTGPRALDGLCHGLTMQTHVLPLLDPRSRLPPPPAPSYPALARFVLHDDVVQKRTLTDAMVKAKGKGAWLLPDLAFALSYRLEHKHHHLVVPTPCCASRLPLPASRLLLHHLVLPTTPCSCSSLLLIQGGAAAGQELKGWQQVPMGLSRQVPCGCRGARASRQALAPAA